VYSDTTGITADTVYAVPQSDQLTNQHVLIKPDTSIAASDFQLSADSIEALRNSKDFYYAKTLEKKLQELATRRQPHREPTEESGGKSIFDSSAMPIILWSIAVIFILFILYKIFSTSGFFNRNVYASRVNELPEEIQTSQVTDYDRALEEAVQQGNYRLATRFLYLQLLLRLSEKNLIVLETDKTNYQYILELSNTLYKNDFADITLFYEYVWYGEFGLDEDSFNRFREQCKQFKNRL